MENGFKNIFHTTFAANILQISFQTFLKHLLDSFCDVLRESFKNIFKTLCKMVLKTFFIQHLLQTFFKGHFKMF